MAFLHTLSSFLSDAAASAASLAKAVILSRRPKKPTRILAGKELVVLGNGPSLRSLLDEHADFLKGRDLMCVNFAANTHEFKTLAPSHYILADPHFFDAVDKDPNVATLWDNICDVRHPMTLHVPASRHTHPMVCRFLSQGSGRLTSFFNLTPGEGFLWWRHLLYDLGAAMPRPRNVMIPAIMQSIAAGYRMIYLAGADHTWSRTLSVDDENRVVSVQPHFYADNDKERARVSTEYAGYHLHDILRSLYTAFASYHTIAAYAAEKGVHIINITPGSFIDAFPRLSLTAAVPFKPKP